ncbi:polyketide cyclase/dehydrase/lipid transport protein [Herbihabitans rhizosphaerae]|uniref:Polyketide cyclase/dehydrase/lipid transport protein n=1 Tax=Herbihabitans rhizosphaerae TaxID=1872711 RepID=A0A4Q7KR52_9PSEU|nr:SRPBCC family protein [Herbihabitans rhizosphaerae]RZS37822.1 polyketide cyclase/dehydrase/lipid transport protein [Herbihabitans rhizosphaerae]
MSTPTARGEIDIDAPAEDVYRVVSDLPAMAVAAEEFVGGSWLRGAEEAAPGARFRGRNRRGWRRWSTLATVTDAEPGRRFAFEVTSLGLPVARWQYDLEPRGDGCRLTESTWDKRKSWFSRLTVVATGVSDRASVNTENIARTLSRVKVAVETR